jgi:PhzF family phenazine biosynthesis protein
MKLPLYQIDAFTDRIFHGNPAGVVPLTSWLPDETLLKIAQENAVAETAFFLRDDDKFQLRWFTPEIEMDLCGHATLATAHCLKTFLNYSNRKVVFQTLSGELKVTFQKDLYCLDFPSRMPQPSELPEIISRSLSIQPKKILKSRDYVLVYEREADVRNIKIDRQTFDLINLNAGGVIITAKGDTCDFVSRYFTPQASILEDPVTGSAHCSLIPFWSNQLNKKDLHARQISARGGELFCQDKGERVIIAGKARTYAAGHIWIE